jgi:hypothetical protein
MSKKTALTHTHTAAAPLPTPEPAPPAPAAATRKPRSNEPWAPKERAPEERERRLPVVKRLFDRFIAAASPKRVDYGRLGVDEGAIAGVLAQLELTASAMHAVAPKRVAKAPEGIRVGSFVRYKKAAEREEIREVAGSGPIAVVAIHATHVRVMCGGATFTPSPKQIELDPDVAQPDDRTECDDDLALLQIAVEAPDDAIPFGSEDDDDPEMDDDDE